MEVGVAFSKEKEFNLAGMTSIPDNYFKGTTKFIDPVTKEEIFDLEIPTGITSIGKNAFSECRTIKNLTISDSVVTIGVNFAEYCTSLEEITFPENETFQTIPTYACINCTKLNTVNLPESITAISKGAFQSCSSLQYIDLGNIVDIGVIAFYRTKLSSINLGDGLTTLGNRCFESCQYSGTVTIPSSVTSVGVQVFYASKVTTVVWGCNVNVPEDAFYNSAIEKIIFGNNVSINQIGPRAFYGCANLGKNSGGFFQYDSAGSSSGWNGWTNLTSIGDSAFYNCSSLIGTIYLRQSCVYDEDTTFYNCGLTRKVYRGS